MLESGAEDGIDEVEGQNRRRGVDSSGSECHVDHGRHEEGKNSLEGAHFEVLVDFDSTTVSCGFQVSWSLVFRYGQEEWGCDGVAR